MTLKSQHRKSKIGTPATMEDMDDRNGEPKSKIARLIETYDLESIGDELEQRWTRAENRYGLRQLADYFNRQLLRAALGRETANFRGEEIDLLYNQITSDDVSSGVRTQAQTQLEQHDIDVDQLTTDFVSRQAVHTYLTSVRNVTAPQDDRPPKKRLNHKHDVIQRLKQRLVVVTEQALTGLTRAGHLTLGEFDVYVRIQIHCADCATQYSVTDILTRGGCDCAT